MDNKSMKQNPMGSGEAQAGGGNASMDTNAAISDPANFDASLWPIREELAAAYRICYTLGLNRMTYNHLSADCGGGKFLVNRYGLSWREVTAANLCLVGTDGRLIEGEGPVMTAAFMIHAAIHETLGDSARVVMHTHQEAATALTALQLNRVMDISAGTCGAESTVPYIRGALAMPLVAGRRCVVDTDYKGIVNNPAEGVRIARVLQEHDAAAHTDAAAGASVTAGTGVSVRLGAGVRVLLMSAHGVTCVAPSVALALSGLVELELRSLICVHRCALASCHQYSGNDGDVLDAMRQEAAQIKMVSSAPDRVGPLMTGATTVHSRSVAPLTPRQVVAACAVQFAAAALPDITAPWSEGLNEVAMATLTQAAAATYFAQLRTRAENAECGAEHGAWRHAWNGRGAFMQCLDFCCNASDVGAAGIASATVEEENPDKAGDSGCGNGVTLDVGAVADLQAAMHLLPLQWSCGPDPKCHARLLVKDGATVWSSDDRPWPTSMVPLAKDTSQVDDAMRVFGIVPGNDSRVVLVASPPPAYARALAALGARLRPCIQDAMLFSGHVENLVPDANAGADQSKAHGVPLELRNATGMSLIASAEQHLRRAQAAAKGHAGGRQVLRIALNASIVYVFANSAAHAHSLLDRYDKAAQVQLLAMATGLSLGEITADVICQPQNAFLCGTSSQVPKGAYMHLEAQKRLLRAAALRARE